MVARQNIEKRVNKASISAELVVVMIVYRIITHLLKTFIKYVHLQAEKPIFFFDKCLWILYAGAVHTNRVYLLNTQRVHKTYHEVFHSKIFFSEQ